MSPTRRAWETSDPTSFDPDQTGSEKPRAGRTPAKTKAPERCERSGAGVETSHREGSTMSTIPSRDPGVNPFEEIRSRGILAVAQACGARRADRTHLYPCPACHEDRRSRSDRRLGSCSFNADRGTWYCGRCHEHGDAVTFLAWSRLGRVPGRGDTAWRDLLLAAETEGFTTLPIPAPEPPPEPPPSAEVAALLAACRAPSEDAAVSAWLKLRLGSGFDAAVCDRVVRALPQGASVPSWAVTGRYAGAPAWSRTPYRALVPLFDAAGAARSVRARAVVAREGVPKAMPPIGYSVQGLVMADPFGRYLLEHGALPEWWAEARRFVVVIAEGEPAFLAWACARRGNGAVFGITSGSWSPSIAHRLPKEARVVVATDHDAAGDRYAATIIPTLSGRVLSVRRWTQGKDQAVSHV